MKKLSLLFVSLAICVAAVFGTVFSACSDSPSGETVGYTVTVLGEDEITGVADVTVKWSQSGSEKGNAVTSSEGIASVELPAATYEVTLSGLPEGMTFTPATATASARGITLVLEKAQVNYTVSVKQYDQTPASGVTVTWTANGAIAGTATTAADGTASKSLAYGDYSVTVSNLPLNNIYVGSKQVTGAQPNAEFALESGDTTEYTVTVKSEGQLKFKNYTVTVYSSGEPVASANTDDNGVVTFALPKNYSYNVRVQNVPAGYYYTEPDLTDIDTSVDLILYSEVISAEPAANLSYVLGDIIHDYVFTTPYSVNGQPETYWISDLLEEKKAVILNFWGTNCSFCMNEMPYMQEAYELYGNDIEILAISNYMGGDSADAITAFHESSGYTFPMFRDTYSFTSKFTLSGWPTSVVIDRYGAIARIEEGALLTTSLWQKFLEPYIADDYVQTFTPGADRSDSTATEMAKPDVTVEEGHYENVAAAINTDFPDGCSVSWYGEPEESAEFTWPFLLGKAPDGDDSVLYPSNTDHDNTYSFIYADVTMTAGKVFTFDYWMQTESGYDIFYVIFDNNVIYTLSGENSGWKTCYVYADIVDGSHQLALSYIKDESGEAGFDNVYIKNVRFTEIDAITENTNMIRGAAYGTPAHYAEITKKNDGYYYVNVSALEGAQYAGNDPAPMLFANLTNPTKWNTLALSTIVYATDEDSGDYIYDCKFLYKGELADWRGLLSEYVSLANGSDLSGFIPVDDDLKELLQAFTAHISGSSDNNEWLRLCYFFSHYGSGEPIGNPIIGLTDGTAIQITEGTYTADLTRNTTPFPIARYAFTPEKSGVYTIQSYIPDNIAEVYASQIWIYTGSIDTAEYYSGDDRFNRTGENEQNFVAKVYLKKDTKYYFAIAYLMNETGELKFSVAYTGDSVQVTEPCASNTYVFDENEDLLLSFKVDCVKDEDGYYHAVNSDGSVGDFIYLDFKYPTPGNVYNSLSIIIKQYITDPLSYEKLFKVFDFTQTLNYITTSISDDGTPIYGYEVIDPATVDAANAADYIDYTEIMQAYCDEALKEENDGLLKVNDELVKILTIFNYLRNDSVIDGKMPKPIEGEWLKFCIYTRTIDENNPY